MNILHMMSPRFDFDIYFVFACRAINKKLWWGRDWVLPVSEALRWLDIYSIKEHHIAASLFLMWRRTYYLWCQGLALQGHLQMSSTVHGLCEIDIAARQTMAK